MNALLEKYKALTEREQKLVLVSAVLLIIALFYFAVWSPLNAALDKQKRLLDNQQSLLVWVKDSAARAQQLRRSSGGKRTFSGSLPQAVNRTTAQYDIAISRMQPQGDGRAAFGCGLAQVRNVAICVAVKSGEAHLNPVLCL